MDVGVGNAVGTVPDATTATTPLEGHVPAVGPVGCPSKKIGGGPRGVPAIIVCQYDKSKQ